MKESNKNIIQTSIAEKTIEKNSEESRYEKSSKLKSFHESFSDYEEQYISKYINLADTKAGFTFTYSVGALAYVLNEYSTIGIFMKPELSFAFINLLTLIILLVLSSVLSFLVIFPRLSKSKVGNIFYIDVSSYSNSEDYIEALSKLDKNSLTSQKLSHCYDLARVCTKKYLNLSKSMLLGALGILSLIIFIFVTKSNPL